MKSVADHLARIASDSNNISEVDLFFRSALNRYYYSAYLLIRDAMRTLDIAEWGTLKHKQIPDLLEGPVISRIKRQIKAQVRKGAISQSEGSGWQRTSSSAASSLADLLRSAYSTRCIADYEPEILTIKDGSGLSLKNCTLTGAQKWENQVQIQSKTIIRIYEKVGLI